MIKNTELVEIAQKHLYANYKPAPVVFRSGHGCTLVDVDGKEYLDLAAGVAVCAVGHAHPDYVAAVSTQVARLGHVSNYFWNEENILLAKRLTELSGLARAFFCNSGAEANEALFKLTRRHFYAKGDAARKRIIAFDNAFHGRTMGALSMTGTPKYREGFGGLDAVTHVPYGDLGAVEKALGPDVAAIIVEIVQGEGGVLPAPAGFVKALRELATKNGSLLLVDEVQTGIGRLGEWFGYQTAGVEPDAISLAKGLGGGLPIGAMLTSEVLGSALPPGTHGSTYGGNPLACAAASAVLTILAKENLVAGARIKGEYLQNALNAVARDHAKVCEGARGAGLLQGLVLKPGFVARDILGKLVEKGVLLTAAGERVLRFTPPLVVTEAELGRGVQAVRDVVSTLAA